jgi:hypothetical protein
MRALSRSEFIRSAVVEIVAAGIVALALAVWAWIRDAGPVSVVYGLVTLVSLIWLFDRLGWGPSMTARVREWLDSSSFPCRRIHDKSEFHFELSAHPTVHIYKKYGASAIVIEALIIVSPEHQAGVNNRLAVELLRFGVAYKFEGQESVILTGFLAATKSTSEVELLDKVFVVRTAANLVIAVLNLGLTVPPQQPQGQP